MQIIISSDSSIDRIFQYVVLNLLCHFLYVRVRNKVCCNCKLIPLFFLEIHNALLLILTLFIESENLSKSAETNIRHRNGSSVFVFSGQNISIWRWWIAACQHKAFTAWLVAQFNRWVVTIIFGPILLTTTNPTQNKHLFCGELMIIFWILIEALVLSLCCWCL